MTYSTKELIDFLEMELKATWSGKRLIFNTSEKLDNPVVSKALDMDKTGRVFIFRDFRRQIHEYQEKNNVSGLIKRKITFQGKSFSFPEVYNQLIAIEGDKKFLMEAKTSVLDFWKEVTEGMKYYLSEDRENPLTPEQLEELYEEAEWAELDTGKDEVYLGLCWGNPNEYVNQWAQPESGCKRIIASYNKPSSISI
ncbi:hypothetical protein Cyast_1353 [Cyanobacterium stanieri PCC 7202]|uniref:Uncharacterized protein n=1 Tax=Cyanobacterium stanieri (strain ATCC 29140 / PCC 7202) TaxID=292563 RepID=K9YMI9_CYASC|nr:hypothetical protein Cyast_1353 [Cyanobacterium stanieri PCC 7202]